MTFAQLDHRQSHAFGTSISISVHGLILGAVLFFTAIHSPEPAPTPHVPIALFAPNLARPGGPGRVGGSGMEAGSDSPRRPAAPPRTVTPTDSPLDRQIEIAVPAMAVDAPKLLPGSAVDIVIGRGTGPGAGTESGAGFSGQPGSGTGPGGSGSGDDGIGSGDGVTSPQLIHEVRPNYTVEAMRAKIQGRVELDVVVLPDGTIDPKRIRIVHSLDSTFGLDAQALEAVKQWRFRAGTNRHQQPVPVRVRVELTFTLR